MRYAGLMGASVLQIISKNPKFDITALVRTEEKAQKVRELAGVKTLIGSLEDAELMTSTAAKFDVVLQMVCCSPHRNKRSTADRALRLTSSTSPAQQRFSLARRGVTR